MKILLINYMETTAPGGINKTVVEMGKYLSNKHEIIVLQQNPFNRSTEEFYSGFKIIRVKTKIGKPLYDLSPEFYFYLKNNLKEINPDIIHIHGYHTLLSLEVLYLLKKMKIKIPIFFSLHYDPLNHSRRAGKLFSGLYDRIFGKQILKIPDYIISISDYEAKNIQKIQNLDNITVIPHGINYISHKLEREDKTLKLLYVGYLLEYKGVQYIIRALSELIHSRGFNNIELTVIGEGKHKNKLLKLSKQLNVENWIKWKSFMPHEEIIEEMRNNDIFLLLSRTEGYGIVVAEALAMGIPAIVTKRTALEEFIHENGCFGVNCPPDPKEVANIIINIYENNDIQIGPFSNKIRTWNDVINDYEILYKKALISEK